MDESPQWFVESPSGRVSVEIVYVTWLEVQQAWLQWREFSAQAGLEMPDILFDWKTSCDWAELFTTFHVVALKYEGEVLGLLSYADATSRASVKGETISVRPDCRLSWQGTRKFVGVGTCLVAYVVHQSKLQGWEGRVELGEVLSEAKSFFLKLKAETIATTSDNESIMLLSSKAGQELLKRYNG